MILIDHGTFDPITMKAKAHTSMGEIKVHGTYAFGNLSFYNETEKEYIYDADWRWMNV